MADRVPLDFEPPVREIRDLLLGITDEHLRAPTPCPGWSVGALLHHLTGLSWAFTQAATTTDYPGADESPQSPAAEDLTPHWRSRLPGLLEDLALAWKDPNAWQGTARAGGVTMPATAMGAVAINELVMHGWDLARATGQEFAADPRILEHLIEFLEQFPPEGSPGLFGPARTPAPDADLLERALARAGRDPHWRPATAAH
jgi:uncharacterized protein (TIGR03086 family)